MRKPTARTSMGGLVFLVLLVSCLCVGGGAADRGRGRHIRRITAADLPATPENSSNSTLEEPPTNQPGQLIVTEIFNKNTSKVLSSPPKQLDVAEVGREKLPTSVSKDLDTPAEDLDEINRANNSKDIIRFSGNVSDGSRDNVTVQGDIDSNRGPKVADDSEKASSISVPKELNVTQVFRGNALKNPSSEIDDVETDNSTTQTTRTNIADASRDSDETTNPKELIADNVEERSGVQTSPKELSATEALQTSSSTYRSRRPVATNTSSIRPANSSQELGGEAQTKSSKEVNINEVVSSNRGSPRRLRKPILVIRKNGVVVANHTISETEAIAAKNCSEEERNCEPKTANALTELAATPNASNSSVEEVIASNSKENSIETATKVKPHESSSVRPTDGAFNNIDFSSTARMVLQEKIHEDILHHLTTVSYAHYETDYVMDDDLDAFDAESQSSSKNASVVTFGNYDTDGKSSSSFGASLTTPRVDSFDENYARISEGIKHNLDEIEERSVEFEATSERNNDHFGSSSGSDSSYVPEGVPVPPKNDSRVSLEYVNNVDIVANKSAIGNAKRGDLTVANETHVNYERSFVETKIMPQVSSTVKYLIDDMFSTTRLIPTSRDSEEESNNIKAVVNSDSETGSDQDQSLESAEDDVVTANPGKIEESSLEKDNATTEVPVANNSTDLKPSPGDGQTPINFRTQGRGRMFPSERFHANNSNNVDEKLTENTESKRVRTRTSQESNSSNDLSRETEDTASPRSRSYLLRDTSPSYSRTEHSSVSSRRMSSVTASDAPEYTSHRSNVIRVGQTSSRYPPQANNPYRQGITVAAQDVPEPTSPRSNLTRLVRPSSRYQPQTNSYREVSTIPVPDVPEPTSPRSNLIRVGRPSIRYPPQVNSTYREASKEVGTRNDEGNDIPPNNTPPTRSRGETRFAGVSASSMTNEEYPIPPTAAAWSLVTMKEPRTRLSSAGVKPTTTLQLVGNEDTDSRTSGSFNKLTTIYNIITPTTSAEITEKDVFSDVETTTQRNFMTSTESFAPTANPGVLQFTTEDSTVGAATTQVAELTTVNSSEDEESETLSPVDVTTSPKSSVTDDDDLRFDVGTTVLPMLELSSNTTEQSAVKYMFANDKIISTTIGPETTRPPKEDADKTIEDDDVDTLITTTETSGMLGFAYSDTGMSEDGQGEVGNQESTADIKEGEEQKTREDEEGGVGQQVQGDEKDSNQQMDEGQLSQGEADYGGPTGPEAGGDSENVPAMSTTPSTSSSLSDASVGDQEGVDVTTPLPTETQTNINIDTDVDVENENTTSADDEAPETTTTIDDAVTSGDNDTSDSTDDSVNDNATSTTSTTTPSTSADDVTRSAKSVPSFLRVFVEASPREFCESIGTFKKAVADLLTKGSGRIVSSDQVVLRNFGRDQCATTDTQGNSTSATGLLLPVELHLVDEAVNFDRQLNEAFPLIWGQEDMDFPLRILKVDVVATPDEYMTSSIDNAGVIAAIAISCIGAACLLLLTVLLIVMRKRQKKFNYGMRCTPVSLDAYSLDSVSIHDSVRRKAGLRASKRSYGNPAFDDPSAPSHPLNFAGLSAFSTERGAMEDEFARIPHVTPKADELPPGCETKNRYANVLPLPETRVILSSKPHEQLGDYINANYVAGPKNAANFYIACQAPLPSTVTDFWRMVWEQQSKVIMMLTELVENGVEKCADYLPPSEVLDCHRLFGDFQVTLKKREVREKYVISTLQLKNLESNSWREITHLWYVSWPSQGVPEEPNSMIAFLIEARSYMKNRSGPSVVHCSPGTGRTGTVLACDLSIREFEHTRQVDIPRCVARLRRDRAGCVQTRDQYAFIYQVLNLYATKLTGGALDSI